MLHVGGKMEIPQEKNFVWDTLAKISDQLRGPINVSSLKFVQVEWSHPLSPPPPPPPPIVASEKKGTGWGRGGGARSINSYAPSP